MLEIFKKPIIVIVFMMFFFDISNGVCGQWIMPESPIQITTEYNKVAIHPGLGTRVQWKIIPKTNSKSDILDFILDGQQKFCSLRLDKNEPGNFIQLLDGKGKVIDSSYGSFIPVPGFPAPCRMINFFSFTPDTSFKIRKQAGGRKFSQTYFFHIDPITLEQAKENNWVDHGFDPGEKASDLMVVVVKNAQKQVLFKQVWQKDGTWWLYEETLTGKSWRK